MTVEWQARTVGNSVACGRRGADGQFKCQGEVGQIAIGPLDPANVRAAIHGRVAWPLTGYIEVQPGWWAPSRTTREKIEGGGRPRFKARIGPIGARGHAVRPATLPWRTLCPRCGDVAFVSADVLG